MEHVAPAPVTEDSKKTLEAMEHVERQARGLAAIPHSIEKPKEPDRTGQVVVLLNFKDRNLALQAGNKFSAKDGKKDTKNRIKLGMLKRALNEEENDEYFMELADAQQLERLELQKNLDAWNKRQAWERSVDKLCPDCGKKKLEEPPAVELPSRRIKPLTEAQRRGKDREFWLPAHLYEWMREAVRNVEFDEGEDAVLIAELCEKLKISHE